MRPGGVRNLRATRVSGTVGKLRFDPAKSRGSKVRGYKATCRSDSELVASGSANDLSPQGHRAQPGREVPLHGLGEEPLGDGAKRGADIPRS